MAKVHFEPACAVKYVGNKSKEFSTSLARPKPKLTKGDIIIVDKKTSFNLVTKGFGEFREVKSIEFNQDAVKAAKKIEELNAALKNNQEEIMELKLEIEELITINLELSAAQADLEKAQQKEKE